MNKKLLSIVVAVLLLMMTACSSGGSKTSGGGSGADSETIKIGGIFSSSGGASPLGKPELDTVKMLTKEINDNGGINGKKIELIPYDAKSDQNEAVLAMKKLTEQDHVVGIIGGTTSGNTLAMIPLAEKAEVPFISLASSKQIVHPDDGSSRKWIFKTAQGDDIVIPRILNYLKDKGWTKVAWMNVANSFGTGGHETFKALASDYGVQAVIEEEFEADVKDAKSMLTRVKKADPQAIIVWGTAQESAVVTKNIRQLGMDVPIIESHGIASKDFIKLAGDAANGVVFPGGRLLVADQVPDANAQKKNLMDYKKDFSEHYDYPVSTFGGHAWDAFHIMIEAIKAEGADPAKIRDHIENETKDFAGITGVFNMSPDNHNGLSADSLVMIQVKDGEWTLVK
ncbi:MAG TPA: ABC transporter substrate-binding protein [Bacillales bacterium]|nr:ABC transporter substrate-binding protein [Bacillales bacterium]